MSKLQRQNIPLPLKGLNEDIDPTNLPEDMWERVVNADLREGVVKPRKGCSIFSSNPGVNDRIAVIDADYDLSGVAQPTRIFAVSDGNTVKVSDNGSTWTTIHSTGVDSLGKYNQELLIKTSKNSSRYAHFYGYKYHNFTRFGDSEVISGWDKRNLYPFPHSGIPDGNADSIYHDGTYLYVLINGWLSQYSLSGSNSVPTDLIIKVENGKKILGKNGNYLYISIGDDTNGYEQVAKVDISQYKIAKIIKLNKSDSSETYHDLTFTVLPGSGERIIAVATRPGTDPYLYIRNFDTNGTEQRSWIEDVTTWTNVDGVATPHNAVVHAIRDPNYFPLNRVMAFVNVIYGGTKYLGYLWLSIDDSDIFAKINAERLSIPGILRSRAISMYVDIATGYTNALIGHLGTTSDYRVTRITFTATAYSSYSSDIDNVDCRAITTRSGSFYIYTKIASGDGQFYKINKKAEGTNIIYAPDVEYYPAVNVNLQDTSGTVFKYVLEYEDGMQSPLSFETYYISSVPNSVKINVYKNLLNKYVTKIHLYKKETDGQYYLIGSIDLMNDGFLDKGSYYQFTMTLDTSVLLDSYLSLNQITEEDAYNPVTYDVMIIGNERLFVGNIKDGDVIYNDRISWSNIRGFGQIPKDRYIAVGKDDPGQITALQFYKDVLLVGKTNNIYLYDVSSFSPNDWFEINTLRNVGIINKDAVASTPFGLFFATTDGIYMFDRSDQGMTLANLTLHVWQNTYLSLDKSKIKLRYIPGKYYLVVLYQNNVWYVYDIPQKAWVQHKISSFADDEIFSLYDIDSGITDDKSYGLGIHTVISGPTITPAIINMYDSSGGDLGDTSLKVELYKSNIDFKLPENYKYLRYLYVFDNTVDIILRTDLNYYSYLNKKEVFIGDRTIKFDLTINFTSGIVKNLLMDLQLMRLGRWRS